MSTLVDLLSVTTVVGSGVVSGILLIFSNTVMPSLARHPEGAATMVTINEVILNPIFLLLFAGTAVGCAALSVLTLLGYGGGGLLALAGCGLYIVGVFGVTAAVNVPMNDALAARPTRTEEAEEHWKVYVPRWTRWNTVRSVLGIVGATLLAADLLISPAQGRPGAFAYADTRAQFDTLGRTAMPNQAQDLVRRLFEAINGKAHDALPELVAPDYVYRTPDEELRGPAGLQGLLTAYHQGFSDLELIIDEMFGDEDRVATAFTFTGTHDGELMGVPATGRRVRVHGIIHTRVEDGRIVEEWELLDLATMYRQLGIAEGS